MKNSLLKSVLMPAGVAAFMALSGCASGPEVRADYDRSANFGSYKTFAFASPLGTDRNGYQSVVSQHLKAATKLELEARGMRQVADSPQLLVNFNASLSDKLQVHSTPAMGVGMTRGYYGYRGGMYAAWPMYADQTTVTQYKEGTLNIDVVDASRKQLVWEGVVTDSIDQKMMDNVEAAINVAVKAAFAKYPVPAPAAASAAAK